MSCKDGYELQNGKCVIIPAKTCASGGYKDTLPSGQVCTKIAYEGLTCYMDCIVTSICDGNYADTDNIMYTSNNEAVGFKSGSKYYLLDIDKMSWGHTGAQFRYCRNNDGEIAASTMTPIIKTLLPKLPESTARNTLLDGAYWWTTSSGGLFLNDSGSTTGGSCGTCGYCYSDSSGWCYSYEKTKGCQTSTNYCSSGNPLPRTLCVKDCSGLAPLTSCPSYSYKAGSCPIGKVETDTLLILDDGTPCYSCNFERCSSGTYSQCPSGWTRGALASTLSDGTKCYKCTQPSGSSGSTVSYREYTLEANYSATTSACQTNASRNIQASFTTTDGKTIIASASLSVSSHNSNSGSISAKFSAPIPENTPVRLYVRENWSYQDGRYCPLSSTIYVNGQKQSWAGYLTVTLVPYRDPKVRFDLRFGG